MAEDSLIGVFRGYLWFDQLGSTLTIGLHPSGLEKTEEILALKLPEIGQQVTPKIAFGSVLGDDREFTLFSPADGEIVAINRQASESPNLIVQEPLDGGWLVRIQLQTREK